MAAADRHIETEGTELYEYETLVPLWEEALRDDPRDLTTLAWLGHAYTRLGRIEEGLDIDRRLVAELPDDPVARYNLACSLALVDRREEAFDALEKAIGLGYRDPDHMREDPDLNPLRSDPRFEEILERLRSPSE